MDSAGLLQDSAPPAGRFRPYASTKHRVTRGRYITSNDPRGYIPVYEYPLNGQWIMMDTDDGYILWTGIWKALGNAKADIVKMLESQPDLAPQLRRVRGGYLKIQGTWMPYEVAMRLARRVAWPIREDLIPLFGPTFPSTCLQPNQPGYGQILNNPHGKRRGRRSALPPALTPALVQASSSNVASTSGYHAHLDGGPHHSQPYQQQAHYQHGYSHEAGPSGASSTGMVAFNPIHSEYQYHHHLPVSSTAPGLLAGHGMPAAASSSIMHPPSPRRYFSDSHPIHRSDHAASSSPHFSSRSTAMPPPGGPYSRPGSSGSPSHSAHGHSPRGNRGLVGYVHSHGGRERSVSGVRYAPYGQPPRRRSSSFAQLAPLDLPPLAIPSESQNSVRQQHSTPSFVQRDGRPGSSSSSSLSAHENIVLPPIQSLREPEGTAQRARSSSIRSTRSAFTLPPISSLDEGSLSASHDSAAVLRRLTLDDDALGRTHGESMSGSLAAEDSARGPSHVKPTHEQLWTRRRSLSAPPLHPDMNLRQQDNRTPTHGAEFRPPFPTPTASSRLHEQNMHTHGQRLPHLRHGRDPAHRSSLSSSSARGEWDEPSTRDPSPVTPRDEGELQGDSIESYYRSTEFLDRRSTYSDVQPSLQMGLTREVMQRSAANVELEISDDENGERTPRQPNLPALRASSTAYSVGDRETRRPSPLSWRVASPAIQQSELAAYRFGDAGRTPIATSAPTAGRRSPGVSLACRQTGEDIPIEDMDVEFHSSAPQGSPTRRIGSC